MNKGGEWVKDSIHNSGRVVWTNYNILWTYKLSSDIYSRNGRRERTWQDSRESSKEISRKWLICKTRKIQIEG